MRRRATLNAASARPGLGALERLMGMDDAAWARHANPLSGWTRLSVLPLLAVAMWSRVWIGWWAVAAIAAVLLWTWLNPRLFPPSASTNGWMSRGVQGERIWLARAGAPELRHHTPVVRALTAAIFAGMLLMAVGLALLQPLTTIAGLLIAMLSKLWFLDRMVWVRRETGDAPGPSQADAAAGPDDPR